MHCFNLVLGLFPRPQVVIEFGFPTPWPFSSLIVYWLLGPANLDAIIISAAVLLLLLCIFVRRRFRVIHRPLVAVGSALVVNCSLATRVCSVIAKFGLEF